MLSRDLLPKHQVASSRCRLLRLQQSLALPDPLLGAPRVVSRYQLSLRRITPDTGLYVARHERPL